MDYRKTLVVKPRAMVRFSNIDPGYTGKHKSYEGADPEIHKNVERMDKLQYPTLRGSGIGAILRKPISSETLTRTIRQVLS